MTGFSHLDDGTDESLWAAHLAATDLHAFPDDVGHLVVIAAHPDDETLGAAGVMHRVWAAGGRVSVVVATDGDRSHPSSPSHSPTVLARMRREEVVRAVDRVAPGARLHFLGLPDGGLREHSGALQTALEGILADNAHTDRAPRERASLDRALILAPWSGDGHRDHRVTGEIAAAAGARRGIRVLGYPIWFWHWGTPADMPATAVYSAELSDAERDSKRVALDTHASQMKELSGAAGDEPIVHAQMRTHFDRAFEIFVAESAPGRIAAAESLDAAWFDRFYARNADDPWGFEARWYEERKRAVLLAALPARHLGATLEIGCATGLITVELATRATSILAVDAAAEAVRRCRERVAAEPAGTAVVTVEQATLPQEWPEGVFDTIVLSEVGYYLAPAALEELTDRMSAALSEDGCLIAVHWRHPVAAYPQSGDAVHRALRERPEWEATVRHEERDFLLEVFEQRPAMSVAEREGLV